MTRALLITWLCGPAALAIAGGHDDLLRFTNGDQMHGAFQGISPGPTALWQRDDLSEPVGFKTERIRHIVLRGGRPRLPAGPLCHATLVNGDRLPGTVAGLDAATLMLDTTYAGQLRIPRAQVAMLAIQPLGGRMCYHGPFAAEEWEMKDGAPAAGIETNSGETPGRWAFSGAAWHWSGGQPGIALVRKDALPEKSVLRFDLAWKNRLCFTMAFHADFATGKPPGENDKDADQKAKALGFAHSITDASGLPRLFGNSHVLQIYSNYLMLLRTKVDDEGNTSFERLQHHGNQLRLGESGRARIELRSDRRSGAIALFVDDEFTAQWGAQATDEEALTDDTPDARALPAGAGLGFLIQAADAPVRISDIMIAEWNGMPDSARSMQLDAQDVVLMNNGTDRYAGRVDALDAEGRILFEGRHGRFQLPVAEVAEIRFARERLAPAAEAPAGQVTVRMAPIGRISGSPLAGTATELSLLSPLLGDLKLDLAPAVMIEFNSSNQPIDDWDADF
jgi:hypothetical protein